MVFASPYYFTPAIILNKKEDSMRCPYKYKYQLVDWAIKKFRISRFCASRYSKKVLYAIWYNYK